MIKAKQTFKKFMLLTREMHITVADKSVAFKAINTTLPATSLIMPTTIEQPSTRALLISIRTPHVKIQEINESLAELGRLVGTLGFTVFATQTQMK